MSCARFQHATLCGAEREVLNPFLGQLARGIENAVHEVWLFGSRARGEEPDALRAAARESGHPTTAWTFSLHVHDPSWLPRRRAVGSLFVEELERDRITVYPA